MALAQLLGGSDTGAFLREHFLKLPYARPGGCAHLRGLAAGEAIGAILACSGVDVLAGREGQPWPGPAPSNLAEAREVLAAGYTVGVRRAHRHDAALAELAADFARDFLAPIDVHIYWTPAGCPGFGWHYDAEDVFLLQLQGDKEWSLRKNTVNPWPIEETLPADMRYQREIMPLMKCRLEAGDWLYIPAGYWHRSQAGGESVALSVGVRSVTALDAFDFLRNRLRDDLRWRQRLPPAGAASPQAAGELLASYREALAELGQDLARQLGEDATARAFLRHLGRKDV